MPYADIARSALVDAERIHAAAGVDDGLSLFKLVRCHRIDYLTIRLARLIGSWDRKYVKAMMLRKRKRMDGRKTECRGRPWDKINNNINILI